MEEDITLASWELTLVGWGLIGGLSRGDAQNFSSFSVNGAVRAGAILCETKVMKTAVYSSMVLTRSMNERDK